MPSIGWWDSNPRQSPPRPPRFHTTKLGYIHKTTLLPPTQKAGRLGRLEAEKTSPIGEGKVLQTKVIPSYEQEKK